MSGVRLTPELFASLEFVRGLLSMG
ncbi:hypothetical protein ACFOZ0_28545 [Streptomyces yaanensis]|uniref:Uncharacterized protein n=1 Tax=Streptomyces yaanensis TaxID=1142239 RepID=A0ABV7SL36_9ACTN